MLGDPKLIYRQTFLLKSLKTVVSALLLIGGISLLIGCTDDGKNTSAAVDMEVDMEVDMMPPDVGTTPDDRCPNAQARTQVLLAYPDRVEAFKQDEIGFEVEYYCTFLALYEQGITEATGIVEAANGNFYVVQAEGDAGGSVFLYSNNGEYLKKVGPDINLKEIQGIWSIGEQLVVWSKRSSNLYALNLEGEVQGPYQPPEQASSRLQNLTDLQYLGLDMDDKPRVLATFSDRPPQLFAAPFSPNFEVSEVGPAWAITTVSTPIGDKILISGEVDGQDGGIIRYRPVVSGRNPPTSDGVMVYPTDPGYGDGLDLVHMDDGFFLLDTGTRGDGGVSVNSFNTSGFPQVQTPIALEGTPYKIMRTLIFKDF